MLTIPKGRWRQRVGPESMDRSLKPGDRIRLHFVLSAVTDITRADDPAA